jgi:hypothetical protein
LGVKIGRILILVNENNTVQSVPPTKTAITINIIGKEAILEFKFLKSGFGLSMWSSPYL